ncbi:MAG: uncharacterized protein A8A55_2133 [Amphiamblys sp. WSBS2006]|nr:MAG: uncharacterized protein A8A55_2133 [Amphiamblys sp. WSBS2006]
MSKKGLGKEAGKWLLDTKIVESRGSDLPRHGYSHRGETWTTLDYFLTVGPSSHNRIRVDRRHSDHWPVSVECALTVAKQPAGPRNISRMAIRAKGRRSQTTLCGNWQRRQQTTCSQT